MNHFIQQQSQRVMNLAHIAEARANSIPPINVLLQAMRAFSEDRCSVLAAALSYYALLSLFPLALFILVIASQFVSTQTAMRAMSRFITAYLPSGSEMVRSALEEMTQLRGALTLVSAAGLLWAGSNVFDTIQLGINRAFRAPSQRPIWHERIVSMGMVIGAGILFALSFVMTTTLRLALHYRLIQRNTLAFELLPIAGSILLGTGIFGVLYRYLPFHTNIRWREVWLSAFIASALWEIAKLVFAWYITNLAILNMVYGSLGTIIAVMLWGYISAAILLIGAEIAAVQTGARQSD
jgi:membrane protein